MKLEDMESCSVTEYEFREGRGLCRKCMMYAVCSTAMSPNAKFLLLSFFLNKTLDSTMF